MADDPTQDMITDDTLRTIKTLFDMSEELALSYSEALDQPISASQAMLIYFKTVQVMQRMQQKGGPGALAQMASLSKRIQ